MCIDCTVDCCRSMPQIRWSRHENSYVIEAGGNRKIVAGIGTRKGEVSDGNVDLLAIEEDAY